MYETRNNTKNGECNLMNLKDKINSFEDNYWPYVLLGGIASIIVVLIAGGI